MQAASDDFDVIIDTVPVRHDLNPYMPLLDIDGMLWSSWASWARSRN
jgi:uncharacterized zinc-type alcohol dehydrogenase-like protein